MRIRVELVPALERPVAKRKRMHCCTWLSLHLCVTVTRVRCAQFDLLRNDLRQTVQCVSPLLRVRLKWFHFIFFEYFGFSLTKNKWKIACSLWTKTAETQIVGMRPNLFCANEMAIIERFTMKIRYYYCYLLCVARVERTFPFRVFPIFGSRRTQFKCR